MAKVVKKSLAKNPVKELFQKIALVALIIIVPIAAFTAKVVLGNNKNPLDFSAYGSEYVTTTKVGYSAEYLGTVKRKIPTQFNDEGLETGYPTYGQTLKLTKEQRQAIIAENAYLCSSDTNHNSGTSQYPYNRMDKDGYLYYNDLQVFDQNGQPRSLYKHTGSQGLYLGDISNSEPGIIKKVTYKPRGYNGYAVTGLYAPAGEVVKVQISEADMEATGGIVIHIGQALYNSQANNIWADRELNRMPVILNTMVVNKTTATLENGVYTAYVGSFLGGPIYIRNQNVTFSATISGAVKYSHFILGYTTPSEFEYNAASSVPFFDLEVWEHGVLHSGPRKYADFNYDNLYNAAVLWDKIALVSNQVTSQGVVFLYDPFIAAGAAVAFPGRRSVNCPMDWMSSSLNYNALVTSGAWGNMHEFNHNFQSNWGRGEGGEVTNNALNLVEYSLFTTISSARGMDGYGGSNLSGWNRYTSATWAINQALSSSRENDLSVYAAVLHNFGQDAFIRAIKIQQNGGYGQSMDGWCRAVSEATHYDMTYYFNTLVPGYSISQDTISAIKSYGYPVFVPIASVYQTGRSYNYDGKEVYFKTQRPFQINYGEDFTLDLSAYTTENNLYKSGSIVLPQGFTYTIKKITQPENGTLTRQSDKIYTYTPTEEMYSGEMYVTLTVTPPSGSGVNSFEVTLILELEQTYEKTKNMLQRTTYTYSTESMYESATEAFEAGYAGYESRVDGDNENPTQNSNTDVWYTTLADKNQVVEVRGKIYVTEAGKYRLAIRGRWNVAVYVSLDEGKTYELAASYVQINSKSPNFPLTEGTYKDYQLNSGQWVYFKEVMLSGNNGSISSFVGLGWGKFMPSMPEFDEKGNIIGESPETVTVAYASAYRNSYQFKQSTFTSDYFYTYDYKYDYTDNATYNNQTLIEANYKPWGGNPEGQFKIENLFDNNTNTYIHTHETDYISESNPFIVTADMGEIATANELTFYGYLRNNIGNLGMPKDFVVYGSLDGETFFTIKKCVGQTIDPSSATKNMTITFDKTSFRYYKLVVTKGDNDKYVALSKIEFRRRIEILNGKHISPENTMLSYRGKWEARATLSSFGHVYVGKKNSSLSFTFEGSRLAILSAANYGSNFQVTIDGKKVSSIEIKEGEVSFISNLLQNGSHTVKITCKGRASIDSIVTW